MTCSLLEITSLRGFFKSSEVSKEEEYVERSEIFEALESSGILTELGDVRLTFLRCHDLNPEVKELP